MQRSSLGIPIAIVIAACIIAFAIYMTGQNAPTSTQQEASVAAAEGQGDTDVIVAPVTGDDHIRGNPNAPILFIEYSDYDCPFCKQFHETMKQVMAEYGPDGKVAWVYRQFPLEQLHPNAPELAAASECVAELGGNDAFWAFSDMVFEERGTNEQTDISRLPEFAETAGANRGQFELCHNGGKYKEQIEADVQAALEAGGRGTPHTVVLVGDQQGVINGAQPYANVRQMIEGLLSEIEGGA